MVNKAWRHRVWGVIFMGLRKSYSHLSKVVRFTYLAQEKLTLYQRISGCYDPVEGEAFENIVGEGKFYDNQHFLLQEAISTF